MRILVILLIFLFKVSVYGQGKEVVDSALSDSIKIPAHYTECTGNNIEMVKRCTYKAMYRLISENYVMPDKARELGLEGAAFVGFQINSLGKVDSVQVIKTSGSLILDSAAVQCVQKLPEMKPALDFQGDSIVCKFSIPIKVKFN